MARGFGGASRLVSCRKKRRKQKMKKMMKKVEDSSLSLVREVAEGGRCGYIPRGSCEAFQPLVSRLLPGLLSPVLPSMVSRE